MSAQALLEAAAAILQEGGVENPRREARLLLGLALGRPAAPNEVTDDVAILAAFESFVARRAAREPFAYIAGRKEFWSLDFAVGPGVLIPRPDSETLIDTALKFYPDRATPVEILDMGAGTACLAIAAGREFAHARTVALESSLDALPWAAANIAQHAPACELLVEDWNRDWNSASARRFDMIFCNPPYIRSDDIASLAPEVARFEPRAALDGGPDGLDAYRTLAGRIGCLLKPGGRAFIELGAGQGPAVSTLFAARGMKTLAIAPDLAQIPRCLVIGEP
jgi:release factor glutamine methyltransferase